MTSLFYDGPHTYIPYIKIPSATNAAEGYLYGELCTEI